MPRPTRQSDAKSVLALRARSDEAFAAAFPLLAHLDFDLPERMEMDEDQAGALQDGAHSVADPTEAPAPFETLPEIPKPKKSKPRRDEPCEDPEKHGNYHENGGAETWSDWTDLPYFQVISSIDDRKATEPVDCGCEHRDLIVIGTCGDGVFSDDSDQEWRIEEESREQFLEDMESYVNRNRDVNDDMMIEGLEDALLEVKGLVILPTESFPRTVRKGER